MGIEILNQECAVCGNLSHHVDADSHTGITRCVSLLADGKDAPSGFAEYRNELGQRCFVRAELNDAAEVEYLGKYTY